MVQRLYYISIFQTQKDWEINYIKGYYKTYHLQNIIKKLNKEAVFF